MEHPGIAKHGLGTETAVTLIPFCCYNYSRERVVSAPFFYILIWKQQGHMHNKYRNNLEFMDKVFTMSKNIYLRNYNKCRNNEIVTFISEIFMLPYLEEEFHKN